MIRKHKGGLRHLVGCRDRLGRWFASAKPQAKPTIIVGNKNFTEEFILGQLYGQALKAKGYTVKYAGSLGSSELADTAIKTGKINLLPEYTGVVVSTSRRRSLRSRRPRTTRRQRSSRRPRADLCQGDAVLRRRHEFRLKATAQKYGLKTIGDLKRRARSYAGYPECDKRITCLLGLKQIFTGSRRWKFVQIGILSVETLLDQHKVPSHSG